TKFPYVAGRDFSGVVAALGPGVTDFKVGDPVFGGVEQVADGCSAETLAIRSAIVAKKLASLSHVECASLALTGLTALVSIEDTLKLRPGETILIQGGAGGVASFAIQVAKHIGARVISTASAANLDYVRKLGADQVIDYSVEDFTKAVSGCDAVFDTVGGDVAMRSFAVLRPGGRAAFIGSGPTAPVPPRNDVVSLRPNVGRDRAHLDRISALVAGGDVRVPEIKTYKLSDAAAAHRVSEGRHFRGKLVFKVR
ncbi:MAG: NADP-dependent oxidoreductase, partial [Candidatus Rokuibacteriota bacterium]